MKRPMILAALVAGTALLSAISQVSAAPAAKASKQQIARGEYLIKGIAGCGDCHTPFNERGELVQEKWLQGATLTFGPLVPMPAWAKQAPRIAGLEGWDHEKAVQFLMTGKAPSGQPARPPMPEYRMNRPDAEAVVAYLESLK